MEAKKPITRRDFLKLTGRVGLALGLGAGLGGLVGACRATEEVSNTIATIGESQTTLPTTTTVVAEPGRDLVLGVVSHRSGKQALFGKADEWWMRYAWLAAPQGVVCGDGLVHRVVFAVEDSRSDPAGAERAAERLISDHGADMITCSGDVGLVNAVADRADALGCPCLSSLHLWRPFVRGREKVSAKDSAWAFAHAIGLEDVLADYLAMWGQVDTNRKVGLVLQDDIDGRQWADPASGVVPAARSAGYECYSPGLVSGREEFRARIAELARRECDICCVVLPAEEFVVFRRVCAEQGYQPKILSAGGASLLFPQVIESLGTRARNLTTESLWQPDWPYADSITGNPAQVLAEDYMATTGEMWGAPLAQYAVFEWAVDVFRRVADLDDREAVAAQVRATQLTTCAGPIDLTTAVDTSGSVSSKRPAPNVSKAPVVGVQWVARGAFELRTDIVANEGWPEISTNGTVQPMVY